MAPVLINLHLLLHPIEEFHKDATNWYQAAIRHLGAANSSNLEYLLESDRNMVAYVGHIHSNIQTAVQELLGDIRDAFGTYTGTQFSPGTGHAPGRHYPSYEQPQTDRKKRGAGGLFFMAGSVVSLINSVLVHTRISSLHGRIDSLEGKINEHNTLIRLAQQDIIDLQTQQQRFSLALEAVNKVLRQTIGDVARLKRHTTVMSTSDLLFSCLGDLREYTRQVTEGLYMAWRGTLSPYLIKKKLLLKFLSSMSVEKHRPLFPLTPEFISLYYEVITVTPIFRDENNLVLYLSFLLKDNTHIEFELFKAISYPLPIPNSTLYQQFTLNNEYIAISHDRQYYSYPEMERCKSIDDLHICPPVSLYRLDSAPDCLPYLYVEREIETLDCPTKIISSFNPVFLNTESGFLYVTQQPLDVSLSCHDIDGGKMLTRLFRIQGAGMLTSPSSCVLKTHVGFHTSDSYIYADPTLLTTSSLVARVGATTKAQIKTLEKVDIPSIGEEIGALLLTSRLIENARVPTPPSTPVIPQYTTILPWTVLGFLLFLLLANATCVYIVVRRIRRRNPDATSLPPLGPGPPPSPTSYDSLEA